MITGFLSGKKSEEHWLSFLLPVFNFQRDDADLEQKGHGIRQNDRQ